VLARGVIGGYSVSGRRVAYVKARVGRKWTVVRLHLLRVGRGVNRLETLRLFRTRSNVPPLDAVLTSRGELSWLTPRGVVLRRPDRRPRTITRTRYRSIALEDDATLRLRHGERLAFLDLRPFPGCGGRSRFEPVLETADVIVTRARYEPVDETWELIRACRRADGRDPVVARAHAELPDGKTLDVAGADRDWVVFAKRAGDRYGDNYATIRAIEAGSGRRGPSAFFHEYRGEPNPNMWLPFGGEVAVRDDGVSAWVSQRDDLHRLVAVPRQGDHVVLDSGPPGSLGSLAFDGAALTWTHDGVPRSAIP
jgi:hypothetical protein